MATLHDVASLAGVSASAVSRVLSGAPETRVSATTRLRIVDAARSLDYQPNSAARALKSSRSHVMALIVPDVTNAIFAELMVGVEETALARDYTVVLGRAEAMQPGGAAFRRLVGERRVDGLLVQLRDESTAKEAASLAQGAPPVVFINSPGRPGVSSVVLPDDDGAELATRHLLELGHRDVAMIGGGRQSYTADRREHGFEQAATAAGVAEGARPVVRIGYSAQDGRAGLRRLAALEKRPTGVVVANINAAFGVLLEARSLGIQIPHEMSVIAIHDAATAEYSSPALTTVQMPLRQLGASGAAELFRRLDSPSAEPLEAAVRDPAPVLVTRGSTWTRRDSP